MYDIHPSCVSLQIIKQPVLCSACNQIGPCMYFPGLIFHEGRMPGPGSYLLVGFKWVFALVIDGTVYLIEEVNLCHFAEKEITSDQEQST